MKYSITPPLKTELPIHGSKEIFPVARIFGIGRNYSDNVALEKKEEISTVLFMKDPYMLSLASDGIVYPANTNQLRYEIELVVAIGEKGQNVHFEDAYEYIYGYAVGIDFTKYDVQDVAKKNGWPWDKGKSFLGCAPCSPIIKKDNFSINNNKIWLKKNNVVVQEGSLSQMIWSIQEVVGLVSKSFGLLPGDLIFTGTPKGVGMVEKGDTLEGGIAGLDSINLKIN